MDLSDAQIERYSRQILLKELGGAGQERILTAGVLITGAGAVPPLTALYLAAAGVGRLGLGLDAPSEETAATIHALNPEIQVEVVAPPQVSGAVLARYDVVAHASVAGESNEGLNRAWLAAARPMIVARTAGEGGSVTALPLAGGRGCLACVPWPPEVEASGLFGAPLAGALAALQAIETLKVLTGTGESLHGRLVTLDACGGTAAVADLPASPPCAVCGAT